MTPDAMGPILTKWGDIHKYDFGIPKERKGIPRITSYEDASKVLGHSKLFATFAHRDREPLVEGQGYVNALLAINSETLIIPGSISFFISSNDPARAESEQLAIQDALIGVPGSEDQIAKYFFDKTWSLMANESSHIVGSTIKTVDLGRNVLKFVPIYWACEVVCPD